MNGVTGGDDQRKNFGIFVNSHAKKLRKLLDSRCEAQERETGSKPIVDILFSIRNAEFSLLHFLESDLVLNKTLLTFAYMCAELQEVCNKAQICQLKLMFLNDGLINAREEINIDVTDESHSSAELILRMSSCLDIFHQVQNLLQRCTILGNNTLLQCAAFLNHHNKKKMKYNLNRMFDAFSNLLLQVALFDEILKCSNFIRLWPLFKRILEATLNRPALCKKYNESDKTGLRNCLSELGILFSFMIFRNSMESTLMLKDRIKALTISYLKDCVNSYIKQKILKLESRNNDFVQHDSKEFTGGQQLVSLNAYCAIMHDFCGQLEDRHIKDLLDMNAKYQGIFLQGTISLIPPTILYKHANRMIKPTANFQEEYRQSNLQIHLKLLPGVLQNYRSRCTLWDLDMKRALSHPLFETTVKQFKDLATLLIRGIHYIKIAIVHAKSCILAHIELKIIMRRNTSFAICTLIELISTLQKIIKERNAEISYGVHCIINFMQFQIIQQISLAQETLSKITRFEQEKEALDAAQITEICMHGPATKNSILLAELAIDLRTRSYPNCNAAKYNNLLERTNFLSKLQQQLQQLIDNSFIFWSHNFLSSYLRQSVERSQNFQSFKHFITCHTDGSNMMHNLMHNFQLSKLFIKLTCQLLLTEIINKFCAQIETFLRLEVHSRLKITHTRKFHERVDKYRERLRIHLWVVYGKYIVLKDRVEDYLGTAFYNLITISLNDWKTYADMRHLANSGLHLDLVLDYLPHQTLNQGIDILEILRKIHIFVSRFVYNMNAQIFVEKYSSSKHLEAIGIQHVVNSLRTHGYGVINTTVNLTYQYLRQKFQTFSQFLFDEQIRSRLSKELSIYSERKKTDTYPLYSFERAELFNKGMRKLGLANKDMNYMDLFRLVITQVGNAMGFIRLVRSGSKDANYTASLYSAKVDDKLDFFTKCSQLNTGINISAQNFEINVGNLEKSFSDCTDFLRMLGDAIQPFLQSSNYWHLQNFFLILPPLTINYVEYMLLAKEQINKKDVRNEAVLFDDGFIMGLAYILQLLHQISDFNSLQWFKTVQKHFNGERASIQRKLQRLDLGCDGNEKERLQQTLALTERRISAHELEYNLLYYNLSSAKILFQ